MPKFKFSKLVRDKIVDHQIANGARPSFRQLSPDEHKQELVSKIIEEAKEITSANPDEVADAQSKKNDKNGPFKKGLFIEYVELKDDDQWVDYYRKNSDRYPELE